jgi:hypothetical protein
MTQIIYNNILNITPFLSLESAKITLEHYSELKLILSKIDPEKTNNPKKLSDTIAYVFLYSDYDAHYLVDLDGIHELSSELFTSISDYQERKEFLLQCENCERKSVALIGLNTKCELPQPQGECCTGTLKEL